MHQALQIHEIVCMIVRCLSQPPDFVYIGLTPSSHSIYIGHGELVIRRKALLSLSLTSRSLLEPCLDALWGCMLSARPVWDNIVPPVNRAKVQEGDRRPYHEIMGIAGVLENADWTRLHYYASRVKGLCVVRGDIDFIFGHALSYRSSMHTQPLFPNLRYLCWADFYLDNNGHTSLPYIGLLAGPHITSLKLGLLPWREDCEKSIYETFFSLKATCPLLEDMIIVDHRIMDRDVDWQLALLSSVFWNIANMEFSLLTGSRISLGKTWIPLSRMPNLRALKGTLSQTDSFILSGTVPLDFTTLQHLRYTVKDLGEAAKLLRCLQPPGHTRELKTLILEIRYGIDPDDLKLRVFLNALMSTCSTQTLSSLTLEVAGIPGLMVGEDDFRPLGAASVTLCPLFQFGCIEELRLECLPVELDDAFIAAAATTWPRLRVLHLQSRVPRECGLTPAGLLPLARQCRWLEDQEVQIGSWPDPIPLPQCGSAAGRRNVPLFVCVFYSVMGSSERCEQEGENTARLELIRGIFPNAEVQYYYEKLRRPY